MVVTIIMSITIIIPDYISYISCSNDQFNILSDVSMHIVQVQALSIYYCNLLFNRQLR